MGKYRRRKSRCCKRSSPTIASSSLAQPLAGRLPDAFALIVCGDPVQGVADDAGEVPLDVALDRPPRPTVIGVVLIYLVIVVAVGLTCCASLRSIERRCIKCQRFKRDVYQFCRRFRVKGRQVENCGSGACALVGQGFDAGTRGVSTVSARAATMPIHLPRRLRKGYLPFSKCLLIMNDRKTAFIRAEDWTFHLAPTRGIGISEP